MPLQTYVASLEYLNEVTKKHFTRYRIPWTDEIGAIRQQELPALVDAADIVLAHWWNHPLMCSSCFADFRRQGLSCGLMSMVFFRRRSFSPPFSNAERFVLHPETSFTAPCHSAATDRVKARLRVIRSCSGSRGAEMSVKK